MEQGEYQSNNRISILTKEVEAAETSKANHAAEKEALGKEVGYHSVVDLNIVYFYHVNC